MNQSRHMCRKKFKLSTLMLLLFLCAFLTFGISTITKMMSEIRRTSEAQAEAYFLSHEIADFNNNVERALLERKKRGGSKYQFISPRKTVRLGDLDVIAFTKVRRTFWRDGYSYVVILDDLTIEIASESELKKLIDDFDLIGEPGLPSEQ